MNRIERLRATPLVGLGRFDHPADHPHYDPREEVAPDFTVNFVEHGVFDVQVGRATWRLYPGTVFVTRPRMVYRTRHVEEIPRDRCLTVSYAPEALPEFVDRTSSERQELPVFVPPTSRLAYLHWRALRAAGREDSLALETLAGEIFAAVAACHKEERTRKPFTPRQLVWYAERVQFVRDLLEADPAEPHSLGSLANRVGMSPFHFARIFRELTGTPPHRYLLRVRLARAARMLRHGVTVTDACFASGFANLSHFIRSFRRYFGAAPSGYTPSMTALRMRQGTASAVPRAHLKTEGFSP
jgi:AraC-like DNA-binding protein